MKTLFLTLIIGIQFNFVDTQGQQWKIWNSSNSNLPNTGLYSIYIKSNFEIWIGSSSGLLKFNGTSFIVYDTTNSPIKANWITSIAKDNFNNLWMTAIKPGAGNEGAVMKFDGINNWSYYNSQNSEIYFGNQFCIAVDTNNIVWSYFFKLSRYNGVNWQTYDSTNSPLEYGGGWEIFVDKNNNKWIGTDFYGIYKLNDNINWVNYNSSNSGIPGGFVRKIRQDNLNNFWMTIQFSGLSKFNLDSNTWLNWTPQNSNLAYGHPVGLIVDNNNIKWLGFNSSDIGLAEFNDTTFIYHIPPSGGMNIFDIKQDRYGNLWLATSDGLMEFNKNGIVGINNSKEEVITAFKIQKIYPNPFNPQTKIEFLLNKISDIQIKVYDIKGSIIKNIYFSKLSIGNHSYELDMSSQPSGVYFVGFYQNNNLRATRKISLVK